MFDVISGKDEFDSTVLKTHYKAEPRNNLDKEKFVLGYFSSVLKHPSLDAEIAAAQKKFMDDLPKDKFEIKPIDFDLLDYVVPAYYILTTAEASSNLSRYDGIKYGMSADANDLTEKIKLTRSRYFGKEVKRRIMLGTFVLSEGYYEAYVSKAQKVRRILTEKTKEIFTQVDAIISPVSPTTAFKFCEKNNDPVQMFLADIFTVYANLTGIPAIALPLFRHSNGMPFGVQVMASHANELFLLFLSKQLVAFNKLIQPLPGN